MRRTVARTRIKAMSLVANLAGCRIVVTRPERDAVRLAGRLRTLGAVPIVVPAIQIEFTDPPELAAALADLTRFDWVVFTSKNGVQAVFRLTDTLRGPRVAAIGPVTASALRNTGIEPDLVPKQYVAEAVLDALGDVHGQCVLLPRADIARPALGDGLRARGAEVCEVAAYKTCAAPVARPDMTGVDAITFTSSSTVRGFLEGGPVPTGVKIVCIGPITARTAREHGLEVSEVAHEYTENGLLVALANALGQRAEGR